LRLTLYLPFTTLQAGFALAGGLRGFRQATQLQAGYAAAGRLRSCRQATR